MSELLLDTHTFIWYSESSSELPELVQVEIEDADQVYVSIASLWEIAIKVSLGKLVLQADYITFESGLLAAGLTLLPISFADTVKVISLPFHHRDPFDRILVAQAMNLNCPLVSRDSILDSYSVQRSWL
jgi:PIN domain nuclease of toxin-antitoxin system